MQEFSKDDTEESTSSTYDIQSKNQNFSLFDEALSQNLNLISVNSNLQNRIEEKKESRDSQAFKSQNKIEKTNKDLGLDTLKERTKSKFKQKAMTEEDLIEKFNEEYKNEEKSELNFLQIQKQKEIEKCEKIEELTRKLLLRVV